MDLINDLTPRQQELVDLFYLDGADVSIEVLYREFVGRAPEPHETQRDMQQFLGSYIKAVNDRSSTLALVPGRARRTYRLIAKG